MAYCLSHSDGSVQESVRRIAGNQLERALGEASAYDIEERRAAVHQVRKRCKRVRALLRLVRPEFAEFERENASLRDAAAELAGARDAQVLVDTFERLLHTYQAEADPAMLVPIRNWLSLRRDVAELPAAVTQALDKVCVTLKEVAARSRDWRLECDDFDAIEGGVAKTYGHAVKAMGKAHKSRDDDDFHEWRKRVKYHRFHTALLSPIWPGSMKAHCEAADTLGECLGDHHDLAVLGAALSAEASPLRTLPAGHAALKLVADFQDRLQTKAFALGERVLAETPQALLYRWRRYWELWQDDPEGLEAAQ